MSRRVERTSRFKKNFKRFARDSVFRFSAPSSRLCLSFSPLMSNSRRNAATIPCTTTGRDAATAMSARTWFSFTGDGLERIIRNTASWIFGIICAQQGHNALGMKTRSRHGKTS